MNESLSRGVNNKSIVCRVFRVILSKRSSIGVVSCVYTQTRIDEDHDRRHKRLFTVVSSSERIVRSLGIALTLHATLICTLHLKTETDDARIQIREEPTIS